MKKILALAVFLFASQLAAQPMPGATNTAGTTYIVAARTTTVTDSAGNVWSPDTGLYNLGTPANCPTTAPAPTGTNDPMLYKGARVGSATAGPMVYTFHGLASGAYQVTLYFAECFHTAAGQRVFNVQINSTTAFSNVDIFKAVGKNAAYTLTAAASVATDTMTITFITIPGKDIPMIDAIQLAHVHTATLKWTDTTNPTGTLYNVYRSVGNCSAPTFTKIATNIPGFTYSDATILPQTGYCYQITAQSGATESLPCKAVFVPGSVSTCNCQ